MTHSIYYYTLHISTETAPDTETSYLSLRWTTADILRKHMQGVKVRQSSSACLTPKAQEDVPWHVASYLMACLRYAREHAAEITVRQLTPLRQILVALVDELEYGDRVPEPYLPLPTAEEGLACINACVASLNTRGFVLRDETMPISRYTTTSHYPATVAPVVKPLVAEMKPVWEYIAAHEGYKL